MAKTKLFEMPKALEARGVDDAPFEFRDLDGPVNRVNNATVDAEMG